MEHLEGRIAVLAALGARRRRIQLVLVSVSAHAEKVQDVVDAAGRAGVPVKRVEAGELDRMTHGRTHGGVVAITGPRPPTPLDELLRVLASSAAPPFLVLLEGLEDAQTLGFTLRSAEALGAHGVLVKKHLWDFDPADVSRASSGAYERLPLVKVESAASVLAELRKRGVTSWGCLGGARRSISDVDLTGPVLLALGGEKRGLSGAMRELCDGFLTIPMSAPAAPPSSDLPEDALRVTSLPLGHAAAIVMAEVARQRRARNASRPGRDAGAPSDGS
jgi:23S rRNA (guanosine2251-2'-O)-methyltransferase